MAGFFVALIHWPRSRLHAGFLRCPRKFYSAPYVYHWRAKDHYRRSTDCGFLHHAFTITSALCTYGAQHRLNIDVALKLPYLPHISHITSLALNGFQLSSEMNLCCHSNLLQSQVHMCVISTDHPLPCCVVILMQQTSLSTSLSTNSRGFRILPSFIYADPPQ